MTKQELEQARADAGAEWLSAVERAMGLYVEIVAMDTALSNGKFSKGTPGSMSTFSTPPALPDHPLFRLPDFGDLGERIRVRHEQLVA